MNLNNPFTIQNACEVVREELLEHGDLYNGFKASVVSALYELPCSEDIPDLADRILKRIIGEE